jgi:hypothetical protein
MVSGRFRDRGRLGDRLAFLPSHPSNSYNILILTLPILFILLSSTASYPSHTFNPSPLPHLSKHSHPLTISTSHLLSHTLYHSSHLLSIQIFFNPSFSASALSFFFFLLVPFKGPKKSQPPLKVSILARGHLKGAQKVSVVEAS